MAVSVDRVYQTVLALANKEQRGYITPQEFNLFANYAQSEIFEQYFYDLNQFRRIPGNSTVTSDPRDIIEEKISMFRVSNHVYESQLEDSVYRLESVRYKDASTGVVYAAEEVSKREYDLYHTSPLMTPKINRPIFYRSNSTIYGSPQGAYSETHIDYIRKPAAPNWTYTVVQGNALANPSALDYRDFELHRSEEKNLIVKILQLAGISIKDYNIAQMAGQKEVNSIQQEKS